MNETKTYFRSRGTVTKNIYHHLHVPVTNTIDTKAMKTAANAIRKLSIEKTIKVAREIITSEVTAFKPSSM